jgi:hypothetical protein
MRADALKWLFPQERATLLELRHSMLTLELLNSIEQRPLAPRRTKAGA